MSNKVAQLMRKLAIRSVLADNNEKFHKQRERLEEFFFEMKRSVLSIANEMEGDLFSLKHKEFPKNELREFIKIYQETVLLRKELDHMKPYDSAKKIISKINDRTFRAHVKTLDVIIQHFLKKNEIDFSQSKNLQQVRISSLHHLIDLSKTLEEYMDENPLLQDPRTMTTIAPPKPGPSIIEDPEYKSVEPYDKTNPGKT